MERTVLLASVAGLLSSSTASATILWWEAGIPSLTQGGWVNHLLQLLGLA